MCSLKQMRYRTGQLVGVVGKDTALGAGGIGIDFQPVKSDPGSPTVLYAETFPRSYVARVLCQGERPRHSIHTSA